MKTWAVPRWTGKRIGSRFFSIPITIHVLLFDSTIQWRLTFIVLHPSAFLLPLIAQESCSTFFPGGMRIGLPFSFVGRMAHRFSGLLFFHGKYS